jgi:hypothetical protein
MSDIKEGAWDCPKCGLKKNRGPEKYCGGCGAPRDDDVEFYLPEDAREVVEQEEQRRAELGPDWKCPFCSGDNRADRSFCTGCGAPREGADTRKVVETRIDGQKPQPDQGPPKKLSATPFLVGCGAILLFFIIIGAIFGPKGNTITPKSFAWERTVEVEKYGTSIEKAWEDALPAGAKIISKNRESAGTRKVQTGSVTKQRTVTEKVQSGTERVKVGTKNMGNGYFKDIYENRPVYKEVKRNESYQDPVYRDEPVYKNRVTYSIVKWTVMRTERAGASDHNAYWPVTKLGQGEREGKKTEKYTVLFTDRKGKELKYETVSESEWKALREGQKYKAKVDFFGTITKIEGVN